MMKLSFWAMRNRTLAVISTILPLLSLNPVSAAPPRSPDRTVECEILVVGGGLAGAATAYEALLAGRTVCLTEITDWVGGQISSQGTSALDERPTQREQLFYPRGYLELRSRIESEYGELNPGECWVSQSCFLPRDAHKILLKQLQSAAKRGRGKLNWFPSTVVKELDINSNQIQSVTAIQHEPAENAPPLNTFPLSQTIADWYNYADSTLFKKNIIRFVPKPTNNQQQPAAWYVVEATETGEIIALADVPFRLGVDPQNFLEPSASSVNNNPYCTQGFTYTFAMEHTEEPQAQQMPAFYPQYQPYYSYELERLASFDLVFTYRRIWSPETGATDKFGGIGFTKPTPGDISMQNWTWGNDYRPGTPEDNLIYTRQQLEQTGQLNPGGWMGGLRPEALRKAEEISLGYFYWLVAGTTDSRLGNNVKKTNPNNRFVSGLNSPMGTVHGLSKYPYMREARRIVGRPSFGYEAGFSIDEVDISRRNFRDEYYQNNLSEETYNNLWTVLAGRNAISVILGETTPATVEPRDRATIYPDSVGIGHYAIDFHPCMTLSPPETPGNTEKSGERQGAGQAYPFQIPLRAMIPQKIDNLLVAGKSIATSHVAAAAYRVHSFEWSSGVAAGVTADFALERGILPDQLVDELPRRETQLQQLRQRLQKQNNPTAFPGTSIFNDSWEDWR
ncbi:MAG: FAD-dependent oxidoreductase [Oscillatoria sp. PMC 1068.18]|nr:FAD-dependent oxidoreductase [Oscillatoria sp. PMC 1076.18]MEC4988743.1 FAD-dependent oxidoreductase [Oscillatoria sp. PMC 1068.18]